MDNDRQGAGRVLHGTRVACSMEAFGIGDLGDGEAKRDGV